MSWLFTSVGQSIGASASVSVFPVNIQCWYPLGLAVAINVHILPLPSCSSSLKPLSPNFGCAGDPSIVRSLKSFNLISFPGEILSKLLTDCVSYVKVLKSSDFKCSQGTSYSACSNQWKQSFCSKAAYPFLIFDLSVSLSKLGITPIFSCCLDFPITITFVINSCLFFSWLFS